MEAAVVDVQRPRSIWELLGATFKVYFRVPVLFLVLAAIVVIPYELIVLWVTGAGPLAVGHTGFTTSQLVAIADAFLAVPLISALHVHAVREVGEGGKPRIVSTFGRSLPTLPVVVVAAGISSAAILITSFVVIGFFLMARWAVVAQTAALEGGGWTDPFRRSTALTEMHRWHAFGLLVVAGLIGSAPWFALWHAFGHTNTTLASFAAGTALRIILSSFTALTTALLYFDLKARAAIIPIAAADPDPVSTDGADEERAPGWYIDPSDPRRMRYWPGDGPDGWSRRTAKTPGPMLHEWQEKHRVAARPPAMATDEHTGHSLDPTVYTDEARPPGWYVDPDQPWRMRYWAGGGKGAWSDQTMKTPEKAQSEWRDLRWRR